MYSERKWRDTLILSMRQGLNIIVLVFLSSLGRQKERLGKKMAFIIDTVGCRTDDSRIFAYGLSWTKPSFSVPMIDTADFISEHYQRIGGVFFEVIIL